MQSLSSSSSCATIIVQLSLLWQWSATGCHSPRAVPTWGPGAASLPWPVALERCSLFSSFICHSRALIRPVLSQALAWWAWPSLRRLYRGHGLKVDDLHGALGLAELLKVQALGLAESSSLTSTCLYSQSHKVNERERARAWSLER